MKQSFITLSFIALIYSCSFEKEPQLRADLILDGGVIYTLENPSVVQSIAIKADTILAMGTTKEIDAYKGATTVIVPLNGKTVVPGLVEGHAHIMGIGYNLLNVDLMEAKSYDEVVKMVAERAESTPKGEWIIGRGWHQDKWNESPEMVKGFPTHELLSEAIPDHPVYLVHASSHAALANQRAMEISGVNKDSKQPEGGEFFQTITGQPTGIFNETAQALISDNIPSETEESDRRALELALQECFKYGITGFHQAGSTSKRIKLFKSFAKDNRLKLRLYVMLKGVEETLIQDYFKNGIEEDLYNNQLTIRSVKLYADGALGSRGAWLIEEYSDAPGVHGHNVMPMEDIEKITQRAYKAGFQVCIHAIGDRANKEVLDIYERTYKLYPELAPKEPRFRIEHAQHFHPDDIMRFAELGIVPAMQGIHMSSDRPWAIQRLGRKRIVEGAYMWQDLLKSGARIVNGTDAPVEPINPYASLYASITRKTLKGTPDGGYEPKQRMTREQALRSYTIDAAYGAFREDRKGSIKPGKWADITVLDRDFMTVPEKELLEINALMTIIGGEIVYQSEAFN